MYEHQYDDTGLPTSYLLLTFLSIIFVYLLYKTIIKSRRYRCRIKNCHCEQESTLNIYSILLVGCTGVIFILLRNIYTINMKSLVSGYNPYAVLGVEDNTDLSLVKKSYKKLKRQISKQKKKLQKKGEESAFEDLEEKMIELNKAFGFISKPETYHEWISKQSQKETLMAIPKYLLEYSKLLLLFYSLLLCVGVWLIIKFFEKTRLVNQSKVYFSTLESFLKSINNIESNFIGVVQILSLISRSDDLIEYNVNIDIDKVINYIETTYNEPVIEKTKSYCAIIDFLTRSSFNENLKSKKFIQSKAIDILRDYQKIAIFERPELYNMLYNIERMFIQRVFHPHDYFSQFPFIKSDLNLHNDLNITNKYNEIIRDSEFSKFIDNSDKLKSIMKIYKEIPQLKIIDLVAYTVEPENKCIKDKSFMLNANSNCYVAFNVINTNKVDISEYVHAPYLEIKNGFKVFYTINNQIQNESFEFNTIPSIVKFPVNSHRLGLTSIKVFVLLKGYIGFDISKSIQVKYFSNNINKA
ncbi:hypothetical protein HERIO_704 [Hepatospora eriocheir]|uniref:J domain-containing protein n=1 Tax=Hepatospora eriocheir TaxID=1081669 RepID=A0A1X0QCM0_9MICR|nr:hypothetical protein HERIO_704 [Hepatospora eriocheir]